MNRRWICSDVWMDILPSFDRPKLGLQMALLSYRFNLLVDTHFAGKRELKLWHGVSIEKGAKLYVLIDGRYVNFPLPDRPLPNKIRFSCLQIEYIDHAVLTFLHANKQIWDRSGTNLSLYIVSKSETNVQSLWDIFADEIWPIFATNIHQLWFLCHNHLDTLRRHISPTFLTDCTQLHSVFSDELCPGVIVDHDQFDHGQPNAATVGQALSKWLHMPTTNGQPKRLRCYLSNIEWVNNFKEIFLRATTTTTSAVCYKISFGVLRRTTQIVPFELENERTKEWLTLSKEREMHWLLKRCPISEKAAAVAVKWEDDENSDANLNIVHLNLWAGNDYIGPLSPPPAEEADESNENDV